VVSPYRICPLGAHVDHQLGRVTGMALDQAIVLVFAPAPDAKPGTVRARSRNFPLETRFGLDAIPPKQSGDWGNYLRGAAAALKQQFGERFQRGMVGIIDGTMPVGGLSSSAAVGVAYLLALETVNGLTASAADNIHLNRFIENNYIGLNNGILDQTIILAAKRGRLLALDCQAEQWQVLDGPTPGSFQILVVHSGVEQSLVTTGYNQRVAECRDAACQLLAAAGQPDRADAVLRDVPEEVFHEHVAALPAASAKRATHFFTEQARVRESVAAWTQADLKSFGGLMTASGRSSIENYECGSPPLISLYELLISAPGVFGARFSGAGFRGNCIALIEPGRAEEIAAVVRAGYERRFPMEAKGFAAVVCGTDDGARLL
jgi:galactokinase/galacturonokinase